MTSVRRVGTDVRDERLMTRNGRKDFPLCSAPAASVCSARALTHWLQTAPTHDRTDLLFSSTRDLEQEQSPFDPRISLSATRTPSAAILFTAHETGEEKRGKVLTSCMSHAVCIAA